jgi:beta-lactamase class A
LAKLIHDSDNTAYKVLRRNTTEDERQTIVESIGLGGLFDDQGKLNAKEYSRLLRALYSSAYLNSKNSQTLLELMDESNFDQYLSSSLPAELPFAHKWGQNLLYDVYSDSGIVYVPGRPYIISVMLHGKSGDPKVNNQKAKEIMHDISKFTYAYIKDF